MRTSLVERVFSFGQAVSGSLGLPRAEAVFRHAYEILPGRGEEEARRRARLDAIEELEAMYELPQIVIGLELTVEGKGSKPSSLELSTQQARSCGSDYAYACAPPYGSTPIRMLSFEVNRDCAPFFVLQAIDVARINLITGAAVSATEFADDRPPVRLEPMLCAASQILAWVRNVDSVSHTFRASIRAIDATTLADRRFARSFAL